jgi:hypothetical protein
MRCLWCLHADIQVRRRSKRRVRKTMTPEFRQGKGGGFVKRGRYDVRRESDPVRISERTTHGQAVGTTFSIEKKKGNKTSFVSRTWGLLSGGYSDSYFLK